MPYIDIGRENSGPLDMYYEDHGQGNPVVLIHGYPLSGKSWEKQLPVLLGMGYRVITYDRRGFGESSKPAVGYDYDTFTEDLHKLMVELDLHNTVLVGFSMGTGEVAHYLGRYGSKRVSKAIFISSLPPFLLKTPDNPDGVERSVFEGIKQGITADRPAAMMQFLKTFYNFDVYQGKLVSDEALYASWNVAVMASSIATLACVDTWLTDFRKDLPHIDVPSLIIHGDADRVLPIAATGDRLYLALKGSHYVVIPGAPHGLIWTHAEQVNQELQDFLGQGAQAHAA